MPTISQIYERYQHGAFYRDLGEWMRWCTRPWDLGECRIYTTVRYDNLNTDICIRFAQLPNDEFSFTFFSADILGWGEYGLLERLVEAFQVKFNAFHILPEDHIELGEN